MTNTPDLPRGCRLIDIPSARDERGLLAFATAGREIPFPIARVFWIYDVPEGQKRGGHAHRTCAEVVFALKGGVTLRVDDGQREACVRLSSPTRGLLVEPNVWCELEGFAPETVLMVAASQPYLSEGYINDYKLFKEETKGL
ncbi:MAG: FdtA/QdtA family cupin domain-containing protein [Prevotellaceae bacterium]|nr:FdtA/QdtA family cupin domain-containing protein [Prevotellaceae bacterium]